MKAGLSTKPKAPVAGPSKPRQASPVLPALSKTDTLSKLQLEESKDKGKQPIEKTKDKPKATGKIDFFKAKAKEVPKPEVAKPKADVRKKQFFKAEPSPPVAVRKEVVTEAKVVLMPNADVILSDFPLEGNQAKVSCTSPF